ncbi:MAG: NAD(P)-binding domain-containing protein, partial [Pseudomonadales bacterium]|nr:NAD(P)-binding domain-containing protein [Pseudomonadales bacterium]
MKNHKACIIGAGSSGITTARMLQKNNIQFDWYEMSDNIGGNWYYKNPNGMSSCYQSLHIDTSKTILQFDEFPLPDNAPDYLHHSDIYEYLNQYVDYCNLRECITFNTEVVNAELTEEKIWRVELKEGETHYFDMLFVCNGHHWSPRWPTPKFDGQFDGIEIHSHQYLTPFEPHDLRDKNVVVVGVGN